MRKNVSFMITAGVVAIMLLFSGCGEFDFPQLSSLASRQPQVLSVVPQDGAAVSLDTTVEIEFSQPLNAMTLNPRTLAVLKLEEESSQESLVDDVVDGGVRGMEGAYELSDDGCQVSFRAALPYEGGSYLIVATPSIMSQEMLPLNQQPGMGPTPFVSRFDVSSPEQAGMEDDTGDDAASDSNSDGSGDEGTSEDEDKDDVIIVRNRPATLVINELLYDVPGSDTDGQVFIELFGDAGGDISGYNIYLINGDDGVIKDTIKIPDDSIIPDDGIFLIADAMTGLQGVSGVAGADYVDNFDPQNGPDSAQLTDDTGSLVDVLGYGDVPVGTAENGLACYEGHPAPDVASGQSLSRIEGMDSGDNSVDFHVLDQPTPGVM